jgi:hypothetical protein
LLSLYARAFVDGAGKDELEHLAKKMETSIDVYFQTFWDQFQVIGARMIHDLFLLVPAHALEAVWFVTLAPRWLLTRAEGLCANLIALVNPHLHYTSQPFAPDDELVDMSVPIKSALHKVETDHSWVCCRRVLWSNLRQLPNLKSVRLWPQRAKAKTTPEPGRNEAANARAARGQSKAGQPQREEPVDSSV